MFLLILFLCSFLEKLQDTLNVQYEERLKQTTNEFQRNISALNEEVSKEKELRLKEVKIRHRSVEIALKR